jgi:phosphotriesterase-related protein
MTRAGNNSARFSRREALGQLAAGLAAVSVLPINLVRAKRDTTFAAAQRDAADVAPRRVVQTVTGPVDTAKLGFTLSHEHVSVSSAGIWRAWPELYGGRQRAVQVAVEQLRRARDEGISSIIDVTTFDLGRDVRLLEEVSRKSGVQIIASTGHWIDPSGTMRRRSVEELTDFFIREIERGIDDTDIKAGVIKVATGPTIDEFSERVLRAAARASRATRVSITTHAPGVSRVGERQLALFDAEGLPSTSVCIGHSDTGAADYQMAIVKHGSFLSMDLLPRGGPPTPGAPTPQPPPLMWEQRYAQIKALVDGGFSERVMMGTDHTIVWPRQLSETDRAFLARNPDGVLFISRKTVPALKAMGVSEAAIRAMTVEAPRRFFEGG